MSVNFSIDTTRMIAGIDSIIGAIESASPDAFDDGAKFILNAAREVVPVKTGRLKNSLRVISSSSTELLGGTNTVRYARVVHDGRGRGRNSVPRPYLKNNVDRFQPMKPIVWLKAFRSHHSITS